VPVWGRGKERSATRLSANFNFNAFPNGSGVHNTLERHIMHRTPQLVIRSMPPDRFSTICRQTVCSLYDAKPLARSM
jgi:hypothetical protein